MDQSGWLALLPGNLSTAALFTVALVALAVFFVGVAVTFWLANRYDPVRRRLSSVTEPATAGGGRLQRLLGEVGRLGTLATPKGDAETGKIRFRLLQAGFTKSRAVAYYYAACTITFIAAPVAVLVISFYVFSLPLATTLAMVVMAVAAGYVAPSFTLDWLIRRRQKELRASLPDVLDLLVVCTEAGLGLGAAMQRVAREMSVSHPTLAAELTQVNAEMLAGVDKVEALHNLAERTGMDDIRGLVSILAQSMRFGTSIAGSLRMYAEEFRDRRMQLAQEMAAKLPVKIIFPLVLCFMPGFFIVALGPSVVGFVNMMSMIKK